MKEGESLGLLGRASTIKVSRARGQASGPAAQASPAVGVNASGIDDADRAEIAQRLDEVARANRLPVSTVAFKAGKKGFILPLAVNVAAVILIAASVYLFSQLFAQKATDESVNGTALNSAEGRLLAELKRDSTARLEAKNKEIADIQARMQSLDKEVTNLSASFETRVKTKETELKTRLDAELDAERKRLQAEGLSEPVIQERLKRFEQEKNQEFQRQLEEFKTAANAEKIAAEANYSKLRKEFEANAVNLASEKKRLEDEAIKKEEDLRASLAAELARKNAAATAQAQVGAEALDAAKAELGRLAEEKRKSGLAEEALVGLYGGIRQDLAQADYASALTKADSLRAYLQEPSVASLPGLAGRRDADLFAADSLANLAKLQLDRNKADASLLIKQAEAYEAARKAAEEGHRALGAGDVTKAEQAYQAALAQVPPILEAHHYFVSKAEATEALKRRGLTDALARGGAAYDQGEFEAARQAYVDALDYLPLDAQARKAFLDKLESTVTRIGASRRQLSETRAARDAVTAARASLEAGRWEDAYAGYVGILSKLPASQQADEAVEGAAQAMKGMVQARTAAADAASQTQAELRYRIDGLLKDLDSQKAAQAEALRLARVEDEGLLEDLRKEKDATIAELQAKIAQVESSTLSTQSVFTQTQSEAQAALAASEAKAKDLETRALAAEKSLQEMQASLTGTESALAQVKKDLEVATAKLAEQMAQLPVAPVDTPPVQTGPTELETQLEASLASLKAENEKLLAVSQRHEALKKAYEDYAGKEDALLASSDPGAATDALGNLIAFTASDSVQEVFPGFSLRIQRNWQAFQTSLSANSLADAADICFELVAILKLEDPAERQSELNYLRSDYARQPNILAFLNGLVEKLGLEEEPASPIAEPGPTEAPPPEAALPPSDGVAPVGDPGSLSGNNN